MHDRKIAKRLLSFYIRVRHVKKNGFVEKQQ